MLFRFKVLTPGFAKYWAQNDSGNFSGCWVWQFGAIPATTTMSQNPSSRMGPTLSLGKGWPLRGTRRILGLGRRLCGNRACCTNMKKQVWSPAHTSKALHGHRPVIPELWEADLKISGTRWLPAQLQLQSEFLSQRSKSKKARTGHLQAPSCLRACR